MFFLKALPSRQMVEGYASRVAGADPDRILAALSRLRAASVLNRRLDEYFASHGLSQLRYLALVVIDREPDTDSLSHGEITERLDVSKPVMTRTLKALVAEGQLESLADDEDARGRRYRLTDRGQATLTEVMPGYFAILNEEMQE